jgi:phi LC3 family holin
MQMQINWKVRFKQKVFLTSFISLIVSFVYSMLALFDVFPAITKNQVLEFVNQGLALLGLLGVIVDPTTAGISDSERAMSYDEPYKDKTEAS